MTAALNVATLLEQPHDSPSPPAPSSAATQPPALDAELLLAHVLGTERWRLTAHPERSVSPAEAAQFRALLARRANGEPLAYLTGRREFWSLEFAVTRDVLVPRPETELLIERALALRPQAEARVSDLGTGSGAIAIALAHERPQWQVVATDASSAALAVAGRNSATLGVQVDFRHGDWYAALAGERFDLLLSNPPYVAADDPAMQALRHEPAMALTPGTDALSCLRTLAQGAAQHLLPGGWLVLEHGSTQGAQLRDELVLAGLGHVRSHRDLGGHERTTEGQRR
jgi:release factor glutamine methyltransferase